MSNGLSKHWKKLDFQHRGTWIEEHVRIFFSCLCLLEVPILSKTLIKGVPFHSWRGLKKFNRSGLAQVFQQFFWMRHHGGPTPKRTMLLSSVKRIGIMDRGRLVQKGTHLKSNLVRKYVDGSGKSRWQGTSSLKGSQPLSYHVIGLKQVKNSFNPEHPSSYWVFVQRIYPAGFARSVHDLICWWKCHGKCSLFENAPWIQGLLLNEILFPGNESHT